jgi:hypothetical protein
MWLPMWVFDGKGFTMVHLAVRIGKLQSSADLATAAFASSYQITVAAAVLNGGDGERYHLGMTGHPE